MLNDQWHFTGKDSDWKLKGSWRAGERRQRFASACARAAANALLSCNMTKAQIPGAYSQLKSEASYL